MKLNVGSGWPEGPFKRDPWVNIDMEPMHGARNFIEANVLDGLPFPDNAADEIRCIHVLEHIPRQHHIDFLKELYRVAEPESSTWIEVPDFVQVCRNIVETTDPERLRCWTLSVYGKHRYPGDSHCWGFTPDVLIDSMHEAGWDKITHYIDASKINISSHWTQEPVLVVEAIK